jgi:REP element-mobilizing transposase RayT
MAHTFTHLLTHCIFSTHDRRPFIAELIRNDLHAYLGGIVRGLKGTALAIGGTSDHVHLLARLPAEVAVAECMRITKANSSLWVHERWPERRSFSWQRGYGAFSVSESARDSVVRYIQSQEKHHRKMTFEDEFKELLRKHGVEFDERYLWK